MGLELNTITSYQVTSLLGQLVGVETQIKELRDIIVQYGYTLFPGEVDLLITIKGFSYFTATAFMADVVDINRFSSVKKLCSYLRTAPKIKESNNKSMIGNVNRTSRSLTCSILTQSVQHFKTACEYYNNYYERLRAKKSAGKTRLALIRKVVVAAFHMLNRNQKFKWYKQENVDNKNNELKRIIRRNIQKKILKNSA